MKALVTGANGFVGSHLCEALLAAGDEVKALVRKTSDRRWLQGVAVEEAIGDCSDRESLAAAMEGVDVVFHVAGLTKAVTERELLAVNESGTAAVMSAAARRTTPPVVVVVSSLAAAGPSEDPAVPRDERWAPAPVSAYGRSKLAGERAARGRARDVPVSVVRPPMVYGPRDRDVLEIFKLAVRFPGLVPQPGFGRRCYSAIHVRDLAEALRVVARSGERVGPSRPGDPPDAPRGVYFASDLRVHSLDDLARAAGSAFGRSARAIGIPGSFTWVVGGWGEVMGRVRGKPSIVNLDKAREVSAGHWICDSAKIASLGFEPRFGLVEGFADTARFYRDSRWL